MDEPSLLDYIKFHLNPRNWGKEMDLPQITDDSKALSPDIEKPSRASTSLRGLPWLILASGMSALIAQRFLEPRTRRLPLANIKNARPKPKNVKTNHPAHTR